PSLPDGCPEDWYRPFWNIACVGTYSGDPQELLALSKKIESNLGRGPHLVNEPRSLDVDILFWGQRVVQLDGLQIPHPRVLSRPFTLAPLALLDPGFVPPGQSKCLLQLNRMLDQPLKSIMGIINITPDSFSDGGRWGNEADLRGNLLKAVRSGVSILDLGAESTRPGANPLTAEQEWSRLEPVMALLKEVCSGPICRPWISLDSRHPETLSRAADYVVDIANDVSGLSSRKYVEETLRQNIPAIAMHSLSIPADPTTHLPLATQAWQQIHVWTEKKLRQLEAWGMTSQNFILDPGIGFGKTAGQSLNLLRYIDTLEGFNLPILIGHSRKSFFRLMTDAPSPERDDETIGVSFALMKKPVEFLRVHNYESHVKALLSYQAIAG
ncbi:MAG: dihydropteroate synthase, partial [Bdellovibrionales bacterium]|nr:dihydropteroate synthase [Bdellovibrionales bacterium]